MIIKIKPENSNKRLDLFLAETAEGVSRSEAKKMIMAGGVYVNGEVKSAHYKLKDSDIVKILAEKAEEKKKPAAGDEKKPKFFKLKIIADTADYLVVDKPAGLITHPSAAQGEISLAGLALEEYPEIRKVGEDPARPGIMHRLDKDASGLVVIAKNQASFDDLKSQFKNRRIKKVYTALVYGRIDKDSGEINFPIARSSRGYKMAALPEVVKGEKNQAGRTAISEFAIARRFINHTLLEVKIKTGRTHQIRAHMAAYGHPIVGDDLYGTKKTREKNRKAGLARIFLAATELSFRDLTGEQKEFKIKLPGELEEFLRKVK